MPYHEYFNQNRDFNFNDENISRKNTNSNKKNNQDNDEMKLIDFVNQNSSDQNI